MKNKSTKNYKLHINKILTSYNPNDINVWELFNGNANVVEESFDYLLELYDKLDNNRSDKYIIRLLVSINVACDSFSQITEPMYEEWINKLRELSNKYELFLSETGRDANDDILKELEKLNTFLEQKYPIQDESEEELEEVPLDASEYIDTINFLNQKLEEAQAEMEKLRKFNQTARDKISDKKRKISELDTQVKDLSKQLEKLKKDLDDKEKNIERMQKEIASRDDRISRLDQQRLAKDKQITDLTNSNNSLQRNIASLKETIEKQIQTINDLQQQLNALTETLSKQQRLEIEQEKNKQREQEIDNYILSKLFIQGYTLDTIFDDVITAKLDYSKEEIKKSLERLKTKINITSPYTKSITPIYQVCKPLYATNSIFTLDSDKDYFDMLVTADWHCTDKNIDDYLKKINCLYEYCSKNGISLILNLGDFLDAMQKNKIDIYDENMRLIEYILTNFPSDTNIKQAILGGNHDKHILSSGIDSLQYLEDNREDFINLGYTCASINFINSNEMIRLHHPDGRILDIDSIDDTTLKMKEFLKDSYTRYEWLKDNSYINLLGHFHVPRIDTTNAYAFVPSPLKNKRCSSSGVWHVKVYFDENKKIKYMDIMSLSNEENMKPVMETIYQKKR